MVTQTMNPKASRRNQSDGWMLWVGRTSDVRRWKKCKTPANDQTGGVEALIICESNERGPQKK